MFMKAQQLNANVGTLTESQVIQNKRLKMNTGGQSGTQKKILKMKDDPTICMKIKGHVTKCHSQNRDFQW
jgi:hypothetical protein